MFLQHFVPSGSLRFTCQFSLNLTRSASLSRNLSYRGLRAMSIIGLVASGKWLAHFFFLTASVVYIWFECEHAPRPCLLLQPPTGMVYSYPFNRPYTLSHIQLVGYRLTGLLVILPQLRHGMDLLKLSGVFVFIPR